MWFLGVMAIQAWSGLQQADTIRQNGRLQKMIDDQNEKYAEIDQFNARKAGYSEAARYGSVVDQTIGKERAGYAAQKVDLNYGSAKQVQTDNQVIGFLNNLDLQKQARDKAAGYQREAMNIRVNSTFKEMQSGLDASAAASHGFMSALSTGVSGYSRMSGADIQKPTDTQKLGTSGDDSSTEAGFNASYTDGSKDGGYGSSGRKEPAWFFGMDPSPHAHPTFNS